MSFPARVGTVVVLVGGAVLLWHLRDLLLLVFAGVLLATVISAAADRIGRWTPLGRRAAVATTVAAVAGLLGVAVWWIGGELGAQLQALREQLPRALASLRGWLDETILGAQAAQLLDAVAAHDVSWRRLAGAAWVTLGALANGILLLLLAVFLAAEPDLYRRGALRLLPLARRQQVGAALDASAAALRGWLKGQSISMLVVGIATSLGLALLGVPLALILGVIAALLNFVPFVGPLVSGAVAVLFGFVEGPTTAFYVALLVLAIQQVEGNLLVPLLQKWAVNMPPALALVSVVLAAGIFGLPGILLATPLMVVAMVLVERLYVGPLEADRTGQDSS